MEAYHLVPSHGGWKLEKQNEEGHKFFATKREALEYSINYMKEHSGSLRIHKRNGQIEEERTYPRSLDPKRTKG